MDTLPFTPQLTPRLMNLQILLPFQIFASVDKVTRMVVETTAGAFGLLPQRLDCVAALEAGILTYSIANESGEHYVAVDAGILVKTGQSVRVSVRNAQTGNDLAQLYAAVQREFLHLDAHEREVRASLAKLESGFVRRFTGLQR